MLAFLTPEHLLNLGLHTCVVTLCHSVLPRKDEYEMISAGKGARGKLKKDLDEKMEKIERGFSEAPDDMRDYLRKFAFICQLGYDIYLKKTIIEHMIDDMAEEQFLNEDPDGK